MLVRYTDMKESSYRLLRSEGIICDGPSNLELYEIEEDEVGKIDPLLEERNLELTEEDEPTNRESIQDLLRGTGDYEEEEC